MRPLRDSLQKGLPIVLWATVSLYLLTAPPSWLGAFPYQRVDKLAHIFLFCTGTCLALTQIKLRSSIYFMISIAVLSELLQSLSPQRTLCFVDMGANILGVGVALKMAQTKELVFDKGSKGLNNSLNEAPDRI